MNKPGSAFVRDSLLPARAPPPNSVGIVGWMRQNLFSTPLNSVMTVVILVFIVEMLNSAVEAVVDRIGTERHELSGRAKDLGSAAVSFALLHFVVVWLFVLLG